MAKSLPDNARGAGGAGSIPEEPGGLTWSHKESDTTEAT